MDVAEPIRCVVPTLEGPVLEALSRTTGSMSGREVARLTTTGSEAGIRRALRRLVGQGVVDAEERGGAVLYQLNRDHLAWPAINILVGLRRELLGQLAALIPSWRIRPVHVSMFGSAARRDGDADSDIDLLLVHPDDMDEDAEPWASQIDDMRERVRRWTGNTCQAYQTDIVGLSAHVRMKAPIMDEWLKDGVVLYGPDLPAVLRSLEGLQGYRAR